MRICARVSINDINERGSEMSMRKEKEEDINKTNRISVADFEIESSVANLEELEECMNRLIRKNKGFVAGRKKKVLCEHMGMIG